MPLGAIIGGGLSLLGGLFGNKPKKQTTTTSVDAVKMVAEAERAGFNPVTFLNAGGLAGFMTTTGTESGGGPTFGAALAGAAQTTFDLWRQDQMMLDARAHETKLLDMQLGATNRGQARAAGATAKSFGSNNAKAAGAATVKVPLGAFSAHGNPHGMPTIPEIGETTITNPHTWWMVDPENRDAAAVEEHYGDVEPIQYYFGFSNLLNNAWYNTTGLRSSERRENTKTFMRGLTGQGTPTEWEQYENMRDRMKIPAHSSGRPYAPPAHSSGRW